MQKNTTANKIFKKALGFNIENPAIIALILLSGAYSINAMLDIEPVKMMFSWIGYYFNLTFYNLNSIFPFITNPISPEFMAAISPWIWLRGIIISAFFTAQNITVIIDRRMQEISIFVAAIMSAFLYCVILSFTYNKNLSFESIGRIMQSINYATYLDELAAACFLGLLAGREFGIFCLNKGNEKSSEGGNIKAPARVKVKDIAEGDYSRKGYYGENLRSPRVAVKYISEDEWNSN